MDIAVQLSLLQADFWAASDAERGTVREFAYHRPPTIEKALRLLEADASRVLAGGTDLIPQLREGRRSASHLVDLKGIPALSGIAETPDGGLSIGAVASAAAVARDPRVAARYPAVASSVRLIGSLQVQNRASLGGNICNAAPSADAVPALLCHGARARIAGRGGRRETDLETLFAGPGRTMLGPGELLEAILLPRPEPRAVGSYLRFTPRREMDIAIAGAGAWLRLDEDGRVAEARLFLASVGPTPVRARSAEKELIGARPAAADLDGIGALAAGEARPISDTRGSADYRRALVKVLTARAIAACCRALDVEVAARW